MKCTGKTKKSGRQEKVNMEESASKESEGEKDEDEIRLTTETKEEEEEDDYTNSEEEEELKKLRKVKIERAREHKKPTKKVHTSTMGTLENGGRVPKKLLICIKEEDDIADIDWYGYILDCLRTNLNIIRHRLAIRSWNTLMMRKRIRMETRQICLGNLEHQGEFNPKEEQIGIDLYKGFDVYIEPLSDKKPVTNESSMDEDSNSDGDQDNDNNKTDYEGAPMEDGNEQSDNENETQSGNEKETENRVDISKGTKEVSMEVDDLNEEIIKEKEGGKEKVSEKDGNETENNENMNKIEMKNDSLQKEQQGETNKEKQAKVDKVEKNQEKQDEYDHLTQDEFWDKHFTDKDYEYDFVFETKEGPAVIRDNMQTLSPQLKVEANVIDTFSLVLNHEHKVNSKDTKSKHFFHTRMITKDMFKWKKADGKYDEEKQYAAFSKTIDNDFKQDAELKKMKDLKMAFFSIISHEYYYLIVFNFLKGTTVIINNSKTKMTYEAKYKEKKLFSMHLEEVQHPRAKDVLNKKPTILKPK
ncbi:hypothetical protein Tco_0246571 [Tanacetum coccineum]